MFEGTYTALVTPMREGRVDLQGLSALVEYQIAGGIEGLVPCGTTGEATTLSEEERALVIRKVVEQARGRVPVIAGAGANSTDIAIRSSALAEEAGVDGLLHVTPFYNKPTQAGLIAHFRAIHDASRKPIILYNVPGRTACDMLPETLASLAALPRIVGVKEATGNIDRAWRVLKACPDDFDVLSGDDFTALAFCALGGKGGHLRGL